MSRFLDDLEVRLASPQANDHTGQWELLKPLRYESDRLGQVIEVPTGTSTDFASVPRKGVIAWGLFGGRAVRAAVVHDYLVRMRRVPREVCDLVFLEAMQTDGVPFKTAMPMYLAVTAYTATGLWRTDVDQSGFEPLG